MIKLPEKLIRWCRNERIRVIFWNKSWSEWRPREREVRISDRVGKTKALYECMHELGHYLVQRSDKDGCTFPNGTRARETRRWTNFADLMGEEILAWKHGATLAKKIGLRYSRNGYTRHAAKRIRESAINISSYIRSNRKR